jgi:CRISPR-associated endonuclease/helicase Cas3
MIVFFVSECEKKARPRTAQILDSFAERVGRGTWKTRITMEGLKSLKILLSKKASRNTAVACHRIVGHTNTKLMWIIGNRRKFNRHGVVPTNYTRETSLRAVDNDWYYLESIKICTALAALFHDWGKAWDAFQELLRGEGSNDYVRHEYVSLILWASFVRGRKPEQWLEELHADCLDEEHIIRHAGAFPLEKSTFDDLGDPLSRMIGWLIVGHHLLPHPEITAVTPCNDVLGLLRQIRSDWGLEKAKVDCRPRLCFSRGLPCRSVRWSKQAAKWARRAQELVARMGDGVWEWEELVRPLSQLSRTALMIGDHEASKKADEESKEPTDSCKVKKQSLQMDHNGELWAKSLKKGRYDPVTLDAHLLDVTRAALSFCHFYPYIESHLGYVEEAEALERRSTGDFVWQDRAAEGISKKIKEVGVGTKGFFGLNMSSTGTGKTFGNAKVMRVLHAGRLRYTLALGLRSLTLQTGDEYRERIGLDETELGVLIGSRAVRDLHDSLKKDTHDDGGSDWEGYSGWDEISYSSSVLDEKLSTKLSNVKARKVLYSPVLVCTIDHIMGATEGVKKGRHIVPWLRMLSSDLVIDEVDDFDGNDLIAILRLVHLAGMLGKNVLLSSATIPPAVAQSAFDSYQSGWRLFAKTRGRDQDVLCAWIDELSRVKVEYVNDVSVFCSIHEKFVQNRIKKLEKQPAKRRAEIIPVHKGTFGENVMDAAAMLHARYAQNHNGKNISFGVIRMANISPCVGMARYLLNASLPPDMAIRILPYHSRFPRITRHCIEVELDAVLKRKDPQQVFDHPNIKAHLKKIPEKNVLFIVVATPVEEVGRDHDFDWAVIEPSSIRSLIQMAGRVLRHRTPDGCLIAPNVVLLSHNVRALQGKEKVVYNRPGYESIMFPLANHDLRTLVDERVIGERVDSAPRISLGKHPDSENSLVDLEHVCLRHLLVEGSAEDFSTVPGWTRGPYYLVDIAQRTKPFRKSEQEREFFLCPEEPDLRLRFYLHSRFFITRMEVQPPYPYKGRFDFWSSPRRVKLVPVVRNIR